VLDEDPYTRSYENDNTKVDDDSEGGNYTITFNDAGSGFTLEKANYTAGVTNRFTGDVLVYYTRDISREPKWTNTDAWTRSDKLIDLDANGSIDEYEYHDHDQPAAGDYPKAGDVVQIGWVPWGDNGSSGDPGEPHGMWIDNNTQECAELVFYQMKDAAGNPTARVYRSNFQFRPVLCINETNGKLVTGMVKGEGMFWNRIGDPDFTAMDIGEFAKEDSSYVVYENWTDGHLYQNTPPLFPNLIIATDGWGGNDKSATFEKDIVTNGNFEIMGDANVELNNDVTGDVSIGRDLVLFENNDPAEGSPTGGGAEFAFNNSGTARVVTIYGNIINNSTDNNSDGNNGGIIYVDSPNNSPQLNHVLNLYGSYYQATETTTNPNGLILYTGDDEDRVTFNLLGESNETIDVASGSVPVLYRLVLNKGSDQSNIVTAKTEFTLNGPTSGVGVDKALELQNGTLILDDPDIDIDLTTGDDDFEIPASAA
jgi:hypothetical protein